MTVIAKLSNHQASFKIADADVEIKENQYLNAEAEYYKATKTRPQRSYFKNSKSEFSVQRPSRSKY